MTALKGICIYAAVDGVDVLDHQSLYGVKETTAGDSPLGCLIARG